MKSDVSKQKPSLHKYAAERIIYRATPPSWYLNQALKTVNFDM